MLVAAGLLFGCATQMQKAQPMTEPAEPKFVPVDLSAKLKGPFQPKIDNFMVILDASASMGGETKYPQYNKRTFAQALISRMNQTIPKMELNSALRSFGHGGCMADAETLLIQNFQKHQTATLEASNAKVQCAGGFSPLGKALKAARTDMAPVSGKTALIIFSDGREMADEVLQKTQTLVKRYGDRVCITTVLIGKDKEGAVLLRKTAELSTCGIPVSGYDIYAPQGMADFVEKVFLEQTPDGDDDGDGVKNLADKCPNTPKGVPVDKTGCMLDADRDGVHDNADDCPNTPLSAPVNAAGCWELNNILFDFTHWNIEPRMAKILDQVISVFKANPALTADVEGHTDSVGSHNFNQALSEKRANSVKKYMVGKEIAADRIMTKGFSFDKPAASNDTAAGRAKNRRADLVIK